MVNSVKIHEYDYYDIEDVTEIIENIRVSFNNANKLAKGDFNTNGKKFSTQGTFDDVIWAWENPLKHSYVYFDFCQFNILGFNKQRLDVTLLVKTWLAYHAVSDKIYDFNTIKKYYRNLLNFINYTNNFSEKFLDLSKGDYLNDYFNNMDCSDVVKLEAIGNVIDYLKFLDSVLDILDEICLKYQSKLYLISQQYVRETASKSLPGSKDIVIFSYYLSKFYEESENQELKLLYMPILIWWKLSNVIPLRISEITRNLYRDCVIKEEGKFYLKIKRVKSRRKSKNSLPILNRLEISEEMAQLIEDYIRLTEPYGQSKTLFSMRALNSLRKMVLEKGYHYRHQRGLKYNEDYFSSVVFTNLLDAFYEDIIFRYYGVDSIKQKVSPSDTRHFAFFSLLLQGVSPIQIALLGGHSTLHTQTNYQYEVSYYVDSELFGLLNLCREKKDFISPYKMKTLKEIVFSMSPNENKNNIFRPLNVGFCKCNFERGDICENLKYCHLCSKWWCEPTMDSYEKLVEYVKNELLNKATKELDNNLNFLIKILSNTFIANESGDLTTDYHNDMKIKTLANKVKEDCEEVVDLRYSLIDLDEQMNVEALHEHQRDFKILD